jgi:hypothetical protein
VVRRNLEALADAYRTLGDRPSACRTMGMLADAYGSTEHDAYLLVHCQPDARGELPALPASSAHLDEYFARMPNDRCRREADDRRANRCLVRTLRGEEGMLELRTLALALAALGRRADACRAMTRFQAEHGTIGGRAFAEYVDQHCTGGN